MYSITSNPKYRYKRYIRNIERSYCGEVAYSSSNITKYWSRKEDLQVVSQDSPIGYRWIHGVPTRIRVLRSNPYFYLKFQFRRSAKLWRNVIEGTTVCRRHDPKKGLVYYRGTSALLNSGGSVPQITLPVGYFMTNNSLLYNKVSQRFYNNMSNVKLNIGLAFLERQQTVNLIAGTANKIYRSYRALRRGRFDLAVEALGIKDRTTGRISTRLSREKRIANQWLEIQYGWQPLLQDVYGAMVLTAPRPILIPIKETGKSLRSIVTSMGQSTVTVTVRDKVTFKGLARPSNNYQTTVNELGLDNPALVAWELVPFSFVVDWFLPLGDWISARTALDGITMVDFNETLSRKIYFSSGKYDNLSDPDTLYIENNEDMQGFVRSKRRFKPNAPSLPGVQLKNPLSVNHALNAIALLTSLKR